jgi:predicted PurR-regulated permease PerM
MIIWLCWRFSDLIAAFALAATLAYLLRPAVDALQRKMHSKRVTAVLLTTLWMVAGFAAVLFLLLPTVLEQLQQLAARWEQYQESLSGYLIKGKQLLAKLGISIGEQSGGFMQSVLALLPQFTNGISSAIGGIGFTMASFFYLLAEPRTSFQRLLALLPLRLRPTVEGILRQIGRMLHHYFRSRILMALFAAGTAGIGFALLGLDNLLLSVVLLFLFDFIPYIGPVLGGILPVLEAFLEGGFWKGALALGILLLVQQLEEAVIGPRLQADAAGIHPLIGIFALFAAARAFGAIGLVLAVPIAGAIRILFTTLRHPEQENEKISLWEQEDS